MAAAHNDDAVAGSIKDGVVWVEGHISVGGEVVVQVHIKLEVQLWNKLSDKLSLTGFTDWSQSKTKKPEGMKDKV